MSLTVPQLLTHGANVSALFGATLMNSTLREFVDI
jgi:hypothetical protein